MNDAIKMVTSMTKLNLALYIIFLFPVCASSAPGPIAPVVTVPVPAIEKLSVTSSYPVLPLKIKENEIRVPFVTSLPLSGDNSIVGKQMLAGVKNYLQTVKAFTRTINVNQKIQFVHEGNNSIQGPAGITRMNELLKESPMVVSLLGSDSFLSLMKLVYHKQLLMLFPVEGSDIIRQKILDNVLYFRPSHQEEIEALTQYSIKFERRKKIALFYEASEWGDSVVAALESILKKYDITLVAKASYSQGTVDVQHAISKIAKESPNAVICLASPRATYNFVRNGINAGLHKCLFLGMSFLHSIQEILKTSRGLDLVITYVVPNAEKSDIQIVKEYKEALKTFLSFRKHSPFYLEAFISLAIAAEIVKNITSDITIDSIIKSCENIKELDFKGLRLNFDQNTRALSTAVWVSPRIGQPWISKKELDEL